MTINQVGALGAQGVGTTTAVATYVAGATTDEVVTFITAKPYTIGNPTNASYSLLGSVTDGTVPSGDGVGSVKLFAFYRGTPNAASSSNTFTVTGGDTAQARTVRVASDKGSFLDTSLFTLRGTDASGTAVSATGAIPAGAIAVGDFLTVCVGFGDDVPSYDNQTLTIPGCTLTQVTTWTKAQTNTGNDLATYVATFRVTAGFSNGSNGTYTATGDVSGKSSAAVAIVRHRDTAPAVPTTISEVQKTLRAVDLSGSTPSGGLSIGTITQTSGPTVSFVKVGMMLYFEEIEGRTVNVVFSYTVDSSQGAAPVTRSVTVAPLGGTRIIRRGADIVRVNGKAY